MTVYFWVFLSDKPSGEVGIKYACAVITNGVFGALEMQWLAICMCLDQACWVLSSFRILWST